MVEHLGNLIEQLCVDYSPVENIVDVGTLAVELGCKPFDVVALGLSVKHLFNTLADV